MSTLLTINVTNNSSQSDSFFFFQKPAIYTGGSAVYSNSIYQRQLKPYSISGTKLTFQSNVQFYAGVQEANTATPPVGASSGFESAIQPIDLTSSGSTAANSTIMTYDSSTKELGLSQPTYQSGVPSGNFRIQTAKYSSPPTFFNAGSAVSVNGGVVLSNFVNALPQTNIDCQPILIFYVAIGNYVAGTVMNFTSSSQTSAVCDFTSGYTTANVTYTNTGDWKVDMS
jgi:hypothetical protein